MAEKLTKDVSLPNQSGTSDLYTDSVPNRPPGKKGFVSRVNMNSGQTAAEVSDKGVTYRGPNRKITSGLGSSTLARSMSSKGRR